MKQLHIFCLGDSLTAGYGVRPEEAWVFLAGRELAPGIVLHNHGLNGDTTSGMLKRLHADILPSRPDVVLIMGGANDIAYEGGSNPARANMPIMARSVAAEGIVPLIGIPLPYIPPPDAERDGRTGLLHSATEYNAYARWLRDFCSSSGVQLVDFRACFEEDVRRTGDAPDGYFFDGLHFTAKGHRVLAACMTKNAQAVYNRLAR
jgi:lysophospholipase L1-like esterase